MAKAGGALDGLLTDLDRTTEELDRAATGVHKYARAKYAWSPKIAREQVDVPIEDLLSHRYFWGTFNIWPAIRDELIEIWHLRCDFDVTFWREQQVLKRDTIYAISFERAAERAREKWRDIAQGATRLTVTRPRHLHTVCIEAPKGSGKDYEASLAIAILVREFLVQDRAQLARVYNLDPQTTFSINCMNRTALQAKKVTFGEVLMRCDIPFFRDYFPPQVDLKQVQEMQRLPDELRFPKNVLVFPGTGTAASDLGYCIASGIIDEVNFMEKSETNERSLIGQDYYDAAEEVYHDMVHRHGSRLSANRGGRLVNAGLILTISSSNTDLDFTKRMRRKAEEDPGIYYSSDYYWARKPLKLSGVTFGFDINLLQPVDPDQAQADYDRIQAAGITTDL